LFELTNFERNYVSNLTTLKTRVIDPLKVRVFVWFFGQALTLGRVGARVACASAHGLSV
jgi:hypothetical protein